MTDPIFVIGFCGAARSGKDTAALYMQKSLAKLLRETDVYVYRDSMAHPIKRMFQQLLMGLDPHGVLDTEGTDKDKEHPALLGRSPRHFLQTLGTDWGRNMIHEDIWVEYMKGSMHNVLRSSSGWASGNVCIIPDIRFDNEAKLCDVIYQVVRPGAATCKEHASEAGLSPHHVHTTFINNGTLGELEEEVALEAEELAPTIRTKCNAPM